MKKDLTLIIVTFNSSEIIEKCLSYLNPVKYDVIVIDNASSDNTCHIVATNFPQVKLIQSDKNLGYGRANNIGLKQAETDFSLILNPDAFLFEADIDLSLKILKNNPNIALASPKVFSSIDARGFENNPQENEFEDSKFIVGGVLFVRMEVFRKIGFFDEDFFMFAEDNEISDRSIKNGYQNVIINSAKAFHSGAGSSKKSLRTTYRRFWHLGWSKSKYKQIRKGKLQTIRATSRLVLVYFCESIFYLLTGNINKACSKIAFSSGCFSFLVGLKSFRKDGTPRG